MKKQNILYIGRFQPFHKGHADAIAQIFEKFSGKKKPIHLFIGIGSAEENFTPQNPLTAGERFEMIDGSLQELNISRENYSIIPIRNIHHYALWPHHVQQYLPPIDIFVSGSPLVQNLWKNAFPHAQIFALSSQVSISATKVRKYFLEEGKVPEKISEKNSEKTLEKKAGDFLLPSTKNFLEKINFSHRLEMMKTEIA